MNGNVVLIPKYVYQTLGNLDPVFHHDIGDVDYGFRALSSGIKVLSTRKAVAIGQSNNVNRFRKKNASLIERFKFLYSPLGSPPGINFYLRKKHFGLLNASLFFIFLHLLALLPDSLCNFLFKGRY